MSDIFDDLIKKTEELARTASELKARFSRKPSGMIAEISARGTLLDALDRGRKTAPTDDILSSGDRVLTKLAFFQDGRVTASMDGAGIECSTAVDMCEALGLDV
jgi:hypothetical protein